MEEKDHVKWEQYVTGEESHWIEDGFAYQQDLGIDGFEINPPDTHETLLNEVTGNDIFYYDKDGWPVVDEGPGPYLPSWETSPVLRKELVNENSSYIPPLNNYC